MHHTDILFALFYVFVAAQIGAEIAQRLKLPSVVGEITAGIVVGPSLLGLVSVAPEVHGVANGYAEPLKMLAEVGAVLLLFSVGLETRLGELRKVGSAAMQVGTIGLLVPFFMAWGWAEWAGHPIAVSMFIAAAFVATSAGITARVLSELGALQRVESRVILGAAVIDDILAMLLLGVVGSFAKPGGVSLLDLGFSLFAAIAFVVLVGVGGGKVMRKQAAVLDAPLSPHSPLILALVGCLGLAALGSKIGLAPIIGAFLAGVAFAETPHREHLEKRIQVIMAFITPFFFVVTGMQIELGELGTLAALGTLATITILAAVGKILGGGFGARSLGKKSAFIVGVGMVPRGEVGIIVATLGLQQKVFDSHVYALIIAMSLLTSVIAPPILKKLLAANPVAPDGGTAAEKSAEEEVELAALEQANLQTALHAGELGANERSGELVERR